MAPLYPLVVEGFDTGVVVTRHGRLWQMLAGIAATCAEQWGAAEEHFETAIRQAAELPHRPAEPEIRRWYARMLLDRAQPGDRDKARSLLGEAIERFQRIGMPRYLESARATLGAFN